LKGYNAFYVPLLFVPLENCVLMNKKGAELDSLSRIRWEFLTRCWEYNVQIWRDTFLEHRFQNPFFFNLVKHMVIPVAAKMAGFYYGLKHGEQMENAISKLANA